MSIEHAVAREHIRDMLARYNIAGDRRDLASFVATFTDDAVYESAVFRCVGRVNIESYLRDAWNAAPKGPTARFRRHNLTTCQIDLSGPGAARSLTYYFVVSDLGPDHSGYYVDEWREQHGRWLLSHREVWMDWCHAQSLYVPDVSKQMLGATGSCGPTSARRANL